MRAFICTACGTQFPPSDKAPAACPICDEERQYVPPGGQGWTTLAQLRVTHNNAWRHYEPGVFGIGTTPHFGIGQRALLLRTPHGNILWDCIALIDDATVALIESLGGLKAIAISHPHFYTTMGEWSRAFGDVPIYLHADDRDFVLNPNPAIRHWSGETLPLLPGVTLVRAGVHFPGGSMLHWADGAEGRGAVFTSDMATVTTDRKFLSFMRSYPNLIPEPASKVKALGRALEPFAFDRIYGHFFDRVIPTGAKATLTTSIARYVDAIRD